LVRMAKVADVVGSPAACIYCESRRMLLKCLQISATVLMMLHLVACAWHFIRAVEDDGLSTWAMHGRSGQTLLEEYTISLLWAAAQLTLAEGAMSLRPPASTTERIFAICVDFCGLLAFAACVGIITTRMVKLQLCNAAQAEQKQGVMRYLRDNCVSLSLGSRILNYEEKYRLDEAPRTSVQGIKALQDLPEALRKELDLEVFRPVLAQHPLFDHLARLDVNVVREITHTAMAEQTLHKKEVLFTTGSLSEHMYIVLSGRLCYERAGAVHACSVGSWVSEAALWINGWLHRGDLEAAQRADTVGLQVRALHSILKECAWSHDDGARKISVLVSSYALHFVSEVQGQGLEDVLHCTDIWGDRQHIANMVSKVFGTAGAKRPSMARVAWRTLRRSVIPAESVAGSTS